MKHPVKNFVSKHDTIISSHDTTISSHDTIVSRHATYIYHDTDISVTIVKGP